MLVWVGNYRGYSSILKIDGSILWDLVHIADNRNLFWCIDLLFPEIVGIRTICSLVPTGTLYLTTVYHNGKQGECHEIATAVLDTEIPNLLHCRTRYCDFDASCCQ